MLKSLSIKNFRALEDFQVSKLGRVNLIVGKNNSGKSSVLEALRIYASSGKNSVLEQIAISHDEPRLFRPDDVEDGVDLPFAALFTGRQFPQDLSAIEIGPVNLPDSTLYLEHGYITEIEEQSSLELGLDSGSRRLRRSFSTALPKLSRVNYFGRCASIILAG